MEINPKLEVTGRATAHIISQVAPNSPGIVFAGTQLQRAMAASRLLCLQQESEQRKLMMSLINSLARHGLTIDDVPKDGMCQYHAVSKELHKNGVSKYTARELKNRACDELLKNEPFYKPFVLSDLKKSTYERMVAKFRELHTWGNEVTMMALANSLLCSIVVHAPNIWGSDPGLAADAITFNPHGMEVQCEMVLHVCCAQGYHYMGTHPFVDFLPSVTVVSDAESGLYGAPWSPLQPIAEESASDDDDKPLSSLVPLGNKDIFKVEPVVPLGSGKLFSVEPVVAKGALKRPAASDDAEGSLKKAAASESKLKRPAAARGTAYDLSKRQLPAGRLMHKRVCDEDRIAEGEKGLFWKRAGSPFTDGGVLGRILSERTIQKHWNVFRTLVTIVEPAGDSPGPLEVCEILHTPGVTKFFTWVQTATTARGGSYEPSTIKSMADSLCVVVDAMVKHKVPAQGSTAKMQRRTGTRLISKVRELSGSTRDFVGEHADPGPVGVVDQVGDSLTYDEVVANRNKFTWSISTLKGKIAKLNEAGASEESVKFMKFRLARSVGALLAFDFVSLTIERVGSARGLIFGRNLKFSKSGDEMIWRRKGPAMYLGKSTKAHRRAMNGSLRLKKVLPAAWTKRCKVYMQKHLPMLIAAGQLNGHSSAIVPPLRDGEDATALFLWTDPSSFRRQVARVGKCPTNDARGIFEYAMKEAAHTGGLHPDVVQYFSAKSKEISLKHYAAFKDGSLQAVVNATGCGG
jgi:hypothetical protein